MLISVHIPKAAGTAFREILAKRFGERLLLDYKDRPLAPGLHWRRLKQRLNRADACSGIETAYDCVHGHFVADKYDALDKPVRHIAWLRDPVQRTISHYLYWKRMPDLRNPDCRRLIEQNLSLEEFAALPRMRNVTTRFFGGKAPRDFFFLGTVETMAESLARFNRLTGIDVDTMGVQNHDDDTTSRADISPNERRVIDQLNRSDRALYDDVCELLAG